MGEIKSALELAMERSRKYVVSDEEREKIKEKEIRQKATALFHRYKDGHLSLHEATKEIERTDEKTRSKVKGILLSQCVDVLSFDEDAERLFDAIESIENRDFHGVREKFQDLVRAYHDEIEKTKEAMSLEMAKVLEGEGIAGEAVVPNVEGSVNWQGRVDRLNLSYAGKLEAVKKPLRKL